MSALLLFVGAAIGVAITIIGGLVIIHWPEPKRDREPVRFSAVGAARAMSTGPMSTYDFLQRRLR
jgi:hypothetical protein